MFYVSGLQNVTSSVGEERIMMKQTLIISMKET